MSTKVKKEVWVCGLAYAPALHVRKFSKAEQRKGYLFHTNFDDDDGDKALFRNCPEVVRVDNCTAWRPMSSVLETIPRVIHPEDVKTRGSSTWLGDNCTLFAAWQGRKESEHSSLRRFHGVNFICIQRKF